MRRLRKRLKIYLSGGLFNVADRDRNENLRIALEYFGYVVILPQITALKRFDGTRFDIPGIVADCEAACDDPDNITVACLDGTTVDDGTAMEFGYAKKATGRVIGYRTDFRTALENELGVNAMFRGDGAVLIYKPCYALTKPEIRQFYRDLAAEIDVAIKQIEAA